MSDTTCGVYGGAAMFAWFFIGVPLLMTLAALLHQRYRRGRRS